MSELIEALKVAEVRKDYQAGAGELGVIYLDCIEDAHLVLEAAQKYRALQPILEELVETRDGAAEGHWWFDPTGITVQPPNGGNYGISMRDNANGLFVAHAANAVTKIKEILIK